MFGLVAGQPIAPRTFLADAPKSLRALSVEHADGWGIAARHDGEWTIERSTACAARCAHFDATTCALAASIVVAHVRKKTVGPTSLANTHPFQRGHLVFAHNGTVKDLDALLARTSARRAAEVAGDTDSERLFAFILTRIDDAADVGAGVAQAVRELHALPEPGSVSFLLSCGHRLYAHRLARSLFVLVRPDATLVASEPFTDEPWRELADRELVVLGPSPARLAA
jgi:glutamine amidotransferase